MFHKEGSTVSNKKQDKKKKTQDVPLRKSDRRTLRQRAESLLGDGTKIVLG